MKLPILAYGDPILKKKAMEIDSKYSNLQQLISDMWETMHNARGVGLAAPQIGLSVRLFIVDTSGYDEDEEGIKQVFINAAILEETGEPWGFNEGCLSIPEIRENVQRKPTLRIRFLDEHWVEQEKSFDGMSARVIQHEYDHIEGKLFIDRINPLRKTMLKSRLEAISKGNIEVDYKMIFPKKSKKR